MGPDYIGPAVDHFQEITAQYPEVRAFDLTNCTYIQHLIGTKLHDTDLLAISASCLLAGSCKLIQAL